MIRESQMEPVSTCLSDIEGLLLSLLLKCCHHAKIEKAPQSLQKIVRVSKRVCKEFYTEYYKDNSLSGKYMI